jgi:hypothetical protein
MVGERRQISRDGAWPVRWNTDCGELVYLGLDSVLYAVPLEGPLEFGDRKSLFRASLALGNATQPATCNLMYPRMDNSSSCPPQVPCIAVYGYRKLAAQIHRQRQALCAD